MLSALLEDRIGFILFLSLWEICLTLKKVIPMILLDLTTNAMWVNE